MDNNNNNKKKIVMIKNLGFLKKGKELEVSIETYNFLLSKGYIKK